jgi:FkbM family methyltransferase
MIPKTERALGFYDVALKLLGNIAGIHKACGLGAAIEYMAKIASVSGPIARAKNLSPADKLMSKEPRNWAVRGVQLELDGFYWTGAREIYGRQVYFPTRDFFFTPGTLVVDLGANYGLFSILAAQAGCSVIAVEAQQGLARKVRTLAEAKGLRVDVRTALIGADRGQFSNEAEFLAQPDVEGIVPRITMNELLGDITSVDFLKVDIEGSEFGLFTGDLSWLARIRKIAMEVHTECGDAGEICRALRLNGFSVSLRDEQGRLVERITGPSGYIFAREARSPKF